MNQQTILDTSLDIIVDLGIENFSMRKLADVLEVKPASIYYYFKTKEDILNGVFMDCIDFISKEKEKSKESDYTKHLYHFLEFVQSHRKKFFFLMKYRDNTFLSQDSLDKMNVLFKKMVDKKELCNNKMKDNHINGLILKGVVAEIVFNPKHHLSKKELEILVKKLMEAFKEE